MIFTSKDEKKAKQNKHTKPGSLTAILPLKIHRSPPKGKKESRKPIHFLGGENCFSRRGGVMYQFCFGFWWFWISHDGSMGLVYLPTFTINLQRSCRIHVCFVPWIRNGYDSIRWRSYRLEKNKGWPIQALPGAKKPGMTNYPGYIGILFISHYTPPKTNMSPTFFW